MQWRPFSPSYPVTSPRKYSLCSLEKICTVLFTYVWSARCPAGTCSQRPSNSRWHGYVRMGAGQEVYPSQELILDKGKSDKSKVLYDVKGIAGMHSQKIGNALRTIDTWYPDEDGVGPIAVEPYGSVTALGKAYRQPKQKQDFYNLLDGWMIKDQVPAIEQQHYVIATLIRGGVFGESGKE